MSATEEGDVPSPALRQRQKRQRRITAGGKAAGAALQAPPKPPQLNNGERSSGLAAAPAAASTASQAEADFLESAWADYLCSGQPAVWAFLLPTMPANVLDLMRRHHPADIFPSHYPHSLPPGVPQLPALDLLPPAEEARAAAVAAAPVPVLRPAGGPPLQLPVVQPTAAQAEEVPAAAIPRLVPADSQPAAAEPDAGGDGSEASSSGQAGTLSAAAGFSSGASEQHCWCSECYPLGSCSYTESPQSTGVEIGRRISWRAALRSGDPVRRNLMPLMNEAAEATAAAAAAAEAALAIEADAAAPAPAAAAAAQPAAGAPGAAPPMLAAAASGRVLRPRPSRRR